MWLTVGLVAVQFGVVILRYVFSVGFIPMQESIWYLSSTMFMLGAGYALQINGHVRVDIFYSAATPRTKAMIDLAGCVILLLPLTVITFFLAAPFVAKSWQVLEGSKEAGGIRGIFLLKTVVLVWAVLVGLQGVALLLRAVRFLRGRTSGYSTDARTGEYRG